MISPNWIRSAVVGMAVAVAFVCPPGLTAQARITAVEHGRLAAMCGTWAAEMTLWIRPGASGIKVQATSTIRPLFEGMFIQEAIVGEVSGLPFGTLAWTGFSTSTGKYEATRISSTNPNRIVETGEFDAKENRFELRGDYVLSGETWHQRTVIEQKSADSMTATTYLSFGTVPEWKSVEIKYTRTSR